MALISPPPRTSELVAEQMHHFITTGAWSVGMRIPAEPDLVEQFGVGRNTIREAVRALEYSGMLVPRRGDGTYVRSRNVLAAAIQRCIPDDEVTDLLTTRRALESEAAALAAQRRDPEAITQLRSLLASANAALAADDIETYVADDIAFHAAIVSASGNRLLAELYDGIGEVIQRNHAAIVASTHTVDTPGGAHRENPEGHDEVVAAIANGEPEQARTAVHRYVNHALGDRR